MTQFRFWAAAILSAFLLAAAVPVQAQDVVVNDDMSETQNGCDTPDESTIAAGISAASAGEQVFVCPGTYNENPSIAKDDLTLSGASESSVILNTSSGDDGISTNADGVTVEKMTIQGPDDSYGIKAEGESPKPSEDRADGLTLRDLTVEGSGRSEIDLNGVDNATLENLTANGNNTSGNGLGLTDVNNVTVDGFSTDGNNDWGGIAVYTSGEFYSGGTDEVTIKNAGGVSEDGPLYSQVDNFSNPSNPYPVTNLEAEGFDYTVENEVYRDDAPDFTHYQRTKSDAIAFAIGLHDPPSGLPGDTDNTASHIQTLTRDVDDHVSQENNFLVGTTSNDEMSIQMAVDEASSGGSVNVESGTFTENVTIDKSVTLEGNNAGTPGDGSRGSESVVDAGSATIADAAFTIESDDVTIDGFQFTGSQGVVLDGSNASTQSDWVGATVQNNLVETDLRGVRIENLTTTGSKSFTVQGNQFAIQQQEFVDPNNSGSGAGDQLGEQTIAIFASSIDGTSTPTLSNNVITDDGDDDMNGVSDPNPSGRDDGAFYGYVLRGVKVSGGETPISGGSISGTLQGIAILDGQIVEESDFRIENVSMDQFAGVANNSKTNFHAGVFVYTGGSPESVITTTGTITGITVEETFVPDTANDPGGAEPSAGLYFGGFSDRWGNSDARQDITVEDVTVRNNANRGVFARGFRATATVRQSTIENNGANPLSSTNSGLGVIARRGADLTVENSFVTNPGTQQNFSVDALQSQQPTHPDAQNPGEAPILTVTDSKIDRNGNGNLITGGTGETNASGNAWLASGSGSLITNGSTIASNYSSGSSNDFTPYLEDGTDQQVGTPGFQGNFSSLTVTTAGAQLDGRGRIKDGIDRVDASGTVNVESGTFTENVTVGRSVTLEGNNTGTPGYDGSRNAESVVNAGTGSFTDAAFTIEANDVTIDGFRFTGSQGVELDGSNANKRKDWVGVTIQNNLVETNIRGVRVQHLTTTSSKSFALQNNQFAIQQQLFDQDGSSTAGDATGEETSSVEVRDVDGPGDGTRPTLQENVIATDGDDDSGGGTDDGSFYGYEIDGLKISSGKTVIAGDPNDAGNTGTIQGTVQAISVLDGQTSPQSDIAIEDFKISSMSGSAPENDHVNFHAGVFTYTATSSNDGTTDVRIANTTVEGLDFSDPYVDGNVGANASANIYLSSFDWGDKSLTQNVTIEGVTIQNTEHRGISLAGTASNGSGADDINATITDASGTTTTISSVEPGVDGDDGTGDGHAIHSEQGGSPTIRNTTITNPSTSGVGAIHVRPAPEPATVEVDNNVTINSKDRNTFESQGASGSESEIKITGNIEVEGFNEGLATGNATAVVDDNADSDDAEIVLTDTDDDATPLAELEDNQVNLKDAPTIVLGSGEFKATGPAESSSQPSGKAAKASESVSFQEVKTRNTGSGDPKLVNDDILRVTDQLTLDNGTFDVTGGTLTLRSTSETSTAYISGSGDGSINGKVKFERTLNKSDDATHFRFLSPPTATKIDDEGNGNNAGNLLSNMWTQSQTGQGADAAVSDPVNSSVYTFNEAANLNGSNLSGAWKEVGLSGDNNSGELNDLTEVFGQQTIDPGRGLLTLLYKDQDPADENVEGFPITLSVTGSVQPQETSGNALDLSSHITYTDDSDDDAENGWNLIANPFMAPIDWESIESGVNNVDATIYVWDPSANSGNGAYASYTPTGSGTNGQTQHIPSFQAFFVKATGSSPDLGGVDSEDKATGESPEIKSKESNTPRISLQLRQPEDSTGETTAFRYAEDASLSKDRYDAYQLAPLATNRQLIASEMAGLDALFDHQNRPMPVEADTIDLSLDITQSGSYTLEASALENLPSDWNVVLEDINSGTQYDLDAGETVTFDYTAPESVPKTESSASPAAAMLENGGPTVARTKSDGSLPSFRLLVGPSSAIPVEFASFEATTSEGEVDLKWQTISETSNAGFAIERKTRDSAWSKVGFMKGAGTTDQPQTYRFADSEIPFEAEQITYRLRQEDLDGTTTLSDETTVEFGAPAKAQLHAPFPNPTSQRATVRYQVPEATTVEITVYDVLGRRVETVIDGQTPAGREQHTIQTARWAPGAYFIRMRIGDTVYTERLSVVR